MSEIPTNPYAIVEKLEKRVAELEKALAELEAEAARWERRAEEAWRRLDSELNKNMKNGLDAAMEDK